jgi:putative DNA methylase
VTEYKRKLIEVSLPLDAINRECQHEKDVKVGKPTSVHHWWARRPLAACRAAIFGALVDDPSARPDQFPTEADQEAERRRLFAILEELVKWENSGNTRVLDAARAEMASSCNGSLPPILDPFCGGGSIPLEARRLHLAFEAGDLNPIAVAITKALAEVPYLFTGRSPVNPMRTSSTVSRGQSIEGLIEDVRFYGAMLRESLAADVGASYPKANLPSRMGGGQATVIAWIWARMVQCPNPACNGSTPLVRSFVLSRKRDGAMVRLLIDRSRKEVRFDVGPYDASASAGTMNTHGTECVFCGIPIPFSVLRDESTAGRIHPRLMAMVAEGARQRIYLDPDPDHERIAKEVVATDPPEDMLPDHALGFRIQAYGMSKHKDLYTSRQLASLCALTTLVKVVADKAHADAVSAGMNPDEPGLEQGGGGARAYADAIALYLGLAVDRIADWGNSLCHWENNAEVPQQLLGQQNVSMAWDFAEANVLSVSTGSLFAAIANIGRSLSALPPGRPDSPSGVVRQADAADLSARTRERTNWAVVVTDPPYYDNIGYADLSDVFYVWLRRSIGHVYPNLLATLLTPKSTELVAAADRFAGDGAAAKRFFEDGLERAFVAMRRAQNPDFPLVVFYAFKQAETDRTSDDEGRQASTGWESMLGGLVRSGFMITGTWPMRSEMRSRRRGLGSNALSSSIVLVCRPRASSAPIATRKDLIAGLNAELPEALRRLQQGNIAPVDLAQAAIGPGMAVYSRYAKVVEADGSAMTVRAALGIVNHVLDQTLAEQEGDFDPDTRWAVAWFEQFGMNPGDFGVAETLSKAKNSAVNALVEAGIVDARAGKVHLRGRDELPVDWDPVGDRRLTAWEVTQHLIRALETGGEGAAAELVGRVGGLSETARELAYRLYNICERKRWAKEALSYNGLVVAWPAILRIATEQSGRGVQMSLGG